MSVTARYGDPSATLDVATEVLRLQLARRSVRRFGARDVTEAELATLVAAAQSAPTSSCTGSATTRPSRTRTSPCTTSSFPRTTPASG